MKREVVGIGMLGCCVVVGMVEGCFVSADDQEKILLEPVPVGSSSGMSGNTTPDAGGQGGSVGGTSASSGSSATSSSTSGSSSSSGAGGNTSSSSGGGSAPIAMCDDGNNWDYDSCTSNYECGIDNSNLPAGMNLSNITAFTITDIDNLRWCYIWFREQRTWEEAKTVCESIKTPALNAATMQLGIVRTKDDLDKVNGIIQPYSPSWSTWVGAFRDKSNANSNIWKWVDGSELPDCVNHPLCIWGDDEPNNAGGSEDCVRIQRNPTDPTKHMRFNDAPCGHNPYFLCSSINPLPSQ